MRALPGKQYDLHGSAPDTNENCLLLIDVINDFKFPRGEELFRQAQQIVAPLASLKRRARSSGIPCVYVNDNFGRWRSSLAEIVTESLKSDPPVRSFIEQLLPDKQDYFVLKPKHSGFYQTPLEILLRHLGAKRLILTGVSTNSCVLFTANDAYMRDLELAVPRDCVAACNVQEHESAIEHMRSMLKADTSRSSELDLEQFEQKTERSLVNC